MRRDPVPAIDASIAPNTAPSTSRLPGASDPVDKLDAVAVRIMIEGVHDLPCNTGEVPHAERLFRLVACRVQPRADLRDIVHRDADMIERAGRLIAAHVALLAELQP